MILVKICGIKDPETAAYAARQGATFIGLVFEPKSHRFVETERAQAIAKEASRAGAIPVGVFTTHSAQDIEAIAKTVSLEVVQLHGKEAKKACPDLPPHLTRIFALHVEENGTVQEEALEGLTPKRDFLLYDGVVPGSGIPFNWEEFEPNRSFRFFLAGGLEPGNVSHAIKTKHPTAVDVSTGVEDPVTKTKDPVRIQKFIQVALEAS